MATVSYAAATLEPRPTAEGLLEPLVDATGMPVSCQALAVEMATIGVIGAAVMPLWNALLPALFGLPAIGFWQVLGVLLLSRILVGGLRGRGCHGHWRGRMMARWERTSEAERERLRAGMGQRCGGGRGSEPTPDARA